MISQKFNIYGILNIFGRLLIILAIFMLWPFIVGIIYKENTIVAFFISFSITLSIGLLLTFISIKHQKNLLTKRRENIFIVGTAWFIIPIFAALPFILSQKLSFLDSYYEMVSGFTTTGFSVIADVESFPKSLLFWRSETQWIGGVGIIVIFIAIFPVIRSNKMTLFSAEASVIIEEKAFPRISDVARWIGLSYFLLTFLQITLLSLNNIKLYDSICITFSALSGGGFSIYNDSLASIKPTAQYITAIFMLAGATNFSVYIYLLRKEFKKITSNNEVKTFYLLVIIFTLTITVLNLLHFGFNQIEKKFRNAFFQVSSILSCTGFTTDDYTKWYQPAFLILVSLMLVGGTSGSAAGGPKVGRIMLFFSNIINYIRKNIHPDIIAPLKFNKKVVTESISNSTLTFLLTYYFVALISSILLSITGVDIISSIGIVLGSLGNIGTSFVSNGMCGNLSHLPALAKILLIFVMNIGRLEIFTVLTILSKKFWES